MKAPHYYVMADGEDMNSWSKRIAAPQMQFWGWSIHQAHCGLSALEHLFRMGAKEGEEETDWKAFCYWSEEVKGLQGWAQLLQDILFERRKVGR